MKVPVFLLHQTRLFQKIKDNLIVYDMSSIFSAFKSCLRQRSVSDLFSEHHTSPTETRSKVLSS